MENTNETSPTVSFDELRIAAMRTLDRIGDPKEAELEVVTENAMRAVDSIVKANIGNAFPDRKALVALVGIGCLHAEAVDAVANGDRRAQIAASGRMIDILRGEETP